jgi:hypothetical protein
MLSILTLGFTLSFASYEDQTSDIVKNPIIIINFSRFPSRTFRGKFQSPTICHRQILIFVLY